jgi:hypothetical protein
MILLGIGHPMLKEQVITRSGTDNAEYREKNPLEMKIADFDDVTYCLKAVDDNLTVFFSMQGMPGRLIQFRPLDAPARCICLAAQSPPRTRTALQCSSTCVRFRCEDLQA